MAEQQIASETLTTRVPEDLWDKVSKMASQERRPLSLMTRLLLEEAIAARLAKG